MAFYLDNDGSVFGDENAGLDRFEFSDSVFTPPAALETLPADRGGSHDFGFSVASDALSAALSFAPVGWGDSSADAKGGNGPGGGGGGGGGGKPGGGGSTATTPSFTSIGVSGDATKDFNITIDFIGDWTQKQLDVIHWAADTISHIITDDIRDDTDLNGVLVDDVLITMSTGNIDRGGKLLTGNVLAQTSVDVARDPGSVDQWLPLNASMMLDSYDLKNSAGTDLNGAWDVIILHEMMHAVGFYGYIFDKLGLASGNSFTGANAVNAYGGSDIPLNPDGGTLPGSHWSETGFAPDGSPMTNELMTNFIDSYTAPTVLSDVTVAALQDLGYHVADADPDPDVVSNLWVVDSGLDIA